MIIKKSEELGDNAPVFQALFSIGFRVYSCEGMSLKEFKEMYGKQFDTRSNAKQPPQKWAVSVSGSGQQRVENEKGEMVGRMKECKWKFWPIM